MNKNEFSETNTRRYRAILVEFSGFFLGAKSDKKRDFKNNITNLR